MSAPCPAAPSRASLRIDAATYLSSPAAPTRVLPQLAIEVGEHCFLPRLDDLAGDWVSHVAVPAFRLLRQERGGGAVGSFCSIGTGSGLDVLSAIEVLGSDRVGLTDVHEDVVAAAVENVRSNLAPGAAVVVEAGWGDLLEPLRRHAPRYDVIYENLPNVAADGEEEVAHARTSSTHVPPRREAIPPLVKRQMLDLHYVALTKAKEYLRPGGVVLSMLGARVPLEVFHQLADAAGYDARFLTYTWKVQAETEPVLRDLARRQREGFGPFHLYPAEILRDRFANVDLAASGRLALDIEHSLVPWRLDAERAWEELKRGRRIGHTAVTLASTPR